MLSRRRFCVLLAGATQQLQRSYTVSAEATPQAETETLRFPTPPDSARPYVLWMWMGHNVSMDGITRDLEAMQEAGIGGATIFSLADTVTPWAGAILKSPTPEVIAFTEPWWALVRHAAAECHRLGLELILHNCAGYESSGGTWIPPELSMQEVVWSRHNVTGPSRFVGKLERAKIDPHPHAEYPKCFIPSEGKIGIPVVEARNTAYREIAVIAMPAEGVVATLDRVFNLSARMDAEGTLDWDVPEGNWTVYRFGHTTTGAMIQPAQWGAMGLECDKMSREAVSFHVRHVLTEMKKHLGDLMGAHPNKGLTTLYFDSYEAGNPTWTPKMREEFQTRRGYDLIPWLPVLAGRVVANDVETAAFKKNFHRTVEDLFRDCYWKTVGPLAHEAGLRFVAEPYEGPWEINEVVQSLDTPAVEFWTTDNHYSPVDVEPVMKAAHRLKDQLVVAEAFTSRPEFARWTEYPGWLKPIGDGAFCAGVNRLNIHHFVHQPWDARYVPGNVMGQWGIHLGRYQTWWKPGAAWLQYLWRCQSLLQRGVYVEGSEQTSLSTRVRQPGPQIQSIHRIDGEVDIYFVANLSWIPGVVDCSFPVQGRRPELWDPVANTRRYLQAYTESDGATHVSLEFAETQSFFVVFQRKHPSSVSTAFVTDFPAIELLAEMVGPWQVSFDPRWGGPAEIKFDTLMDWTKHTNPGIRYYSGRAVYKKELHLDAVDLRRRAYIDLGTVKHIAEVTLNGQDLGVLWTAPWRVEITHAMKPGSNMLEIAVTNVWANRLIGDEQQRPDITWELGDPQFKSGYFLKEFPDWFLKAKPRPVKDRFTFTTWNYFERDAPLEPSGLLGPVQLFSSTRP